MAIGSNLWKKAGNHSKMGRMGQNGRQFFGLHMIAVDSKGNIYAGEVFNGERVQRFIPLR
jgi:hypothetical protein